MFALQHIDQAHAGKMTIQTLQQQQNRTNVAYLEARRYIEAMGVEGGATAKADPWTDCATALRQARKILHRCVGEFGGLADLIAWDVMEFLRTQWGHG